MSLITERLSYRFPVENSAGVISTTPTGRESSCFVPKSLTRSIGGVKLEVDREKEGGLGRPIDIVHEADLENRNGNEGRYGNIVVYPSA